MLIQKKWKRAFHEDLVHHVRKITRTNPKWVTRCDTKVKFHTPQFTLADLTCLECVCLG